MNMTTLSRHGFSPNLVEPDGSGANRVMIVGEAPGAEEDLHGIPFYPGAQSGSVLARAISRIGSRREQFVITNVVPWRPPNNWLEGAPWQAEAIAEGRPYLEKAIATYQPKAILALGGVATRTLTGLAGDKQGISHLCGYVLPGVFSHNVGFTTGRICPPVIPCFHPSYLRRGKMSHMSVLMRALRLACDVAANSRAAVVPSPLSPPPGYITHPTPEQAEAFIADAARADWIAYDIETYYSNSEESAEEADAKDGHDIRSIQFSLGQGAGIFFPWREPFIGSAKRILGTPNKKAGWNNWRFDDPTLRHHNVHINGEVHDLMWAWHHSQPDLPRGLQFAAAHQGPAITQPTHVWPYPWKHLDGAYPQFYGIVDVDVLQWMLNY